MRLFWGLLQSQLLSFLDGVAQLDQLEDPLLAKEFVANGRNMVVIRLEVG